MKYSSRLLSIASFAVTVLFAFPSVAQENFKPGYVIQISGDTIRGSIDQRNWARSPQKIRFRSSSGSAEELAALSIKGFAVNDVNYESAIVETEKVLPDNDPFAKVRFEKIIDTVFVEAVFTGDKCLYEFRVNGSTKFYFIKKDGTFELLSYRKYMKIDRDKTNMVEVKLYKGQLSAYLSACAGIDKKLTTVKYERQSLENVFAFYYKCTGSTLKFVKKADPVKFQFGVLVGPAITSLDFDSDKSVDMRSRTKFSSSVTPSFGISLDIITPGVQKKWSLYNDVTYSSFSSTASLTEVVNPDLTYHTDFAYADKYLKLNDIVRYRIKISKSALVFIGAGIENRISLGPTSNHYTQYRTYYTQHNTSEGSVVFEVRKFSQGVVADAGIQVGKFSFEFRYDRGSSVIGQTQGTLDSFIHTLFFNFGYRFN